MTKRKPIGKARGIDLVREARAGLIPTSDDIAAEKRARIDCAARIIRLTKPYLGSISRVSDEEAITNILADLRHYCDCKGLTIRKIRVAANALYLQDKIAEAM
jgi:hypothetical protein